MKGLITEINDKLKAIISDLSGKKKECEEALTTIKAKIDEKIEEAKSYKSDVDDAKTEIKALEEDIATLEVDLNDLNERFGKKDLNAIVEAGNREINAKIISKQNEITRHREKISELTEKARAIKDLLINLKKDKETKQTRLDNYSKALTYYERELNKIVTYAEDNPDALEPIVTYQRNKFDASKIVDDSPVFDEISEMDESMDKDEEPTEEPVKASKIDFKALNDSIDNEYANIFGNNEDIKLDDIDEPVADKNEKEPENVFDFKDTSEDNNIKPIEAPAEAPAEPISSIEVKEEPKEKIEPLDINLPEAESAPIKEPELAEVETLKDDHTGLTQTDIFGNTFKPDIKEDDDTAIVNLFTSLGIDYYSFKLEDQEYIKSVYNPDMIKKVVDVLNRNNISLDYIYSAPRIFGDMGPNELEHVISKLLLAGQTTQNIGYVLGTLPLINSFDLNEVIQSYGPLIKDANITDLIIKAKHLSDMGGNK